jgi:septal ring factor EnvC (AmiA/AmiB activator)
MSKFYVILPTTLLIIFAVYYTQVSKPAMAAKELADQKAIAEQDARDEANRKQIEIKAQQDAIRQQEERARKDREKEEKLKRQQEEQDNQVRTETDRLVAEATSLSKQIADLQKEIGGLRNQRDALNREVFQDAANVERTKIDRRNAELEIQRMYDMVAKKIDDSFLVKAPTIPPPEK